MRSVLNTVKTVEPVSLRRVTTYRSSIVSRQRSSFIVIVTAHASVGDFVPRPVVVVVVVVCNEF